MTHDVIPIQIRPDLKVRIWGIPHDLTQAEAEKLSAVILAMAKPPSSAEEPGK